LTAVFIFNPVFYALSFTFMTEPFICLAVLSCLAVAFAFLKKFPLEMDHPFHYARHHCYTFQTTGLIVVLAFVLTVSFNRTVPRKFIPAALLSFVRRCDRILHLYEMGQPHLWKS
jgi:hypothetical protein